MMATRTVVVGLVRVLRVDVAVVVRPGGIVGGAAGVVAAGGRGAAPQGLHDMALCASGSEGT